METPNRFVAIAGDVPGGNRLFLDRASLKRDGDHATALSLAMLGAESQRRDRGYTDVVVLRNVRYDCARRTLTVTGQVGWAKYGGLKEASAVTSPPRAATQSPVIAAEIDAVCLPDAAEPAQSFSSVQSAWAFEHDHWPASTTSVWMACLWRNLPAERRERYLKDAAGAALLPQGEQAERLAACAIPPNEAWGVTNDFVYTYAKGRAALAQLGLDETGILSAWSALPWADRMRIARIHGSYTPADKAYEAALFADMAHGLGADGRGAPLGEYLEDTAALNES